MNNAAAINTAYWDEWRQAALAAGVTKPLADMGCEVAYSGEDDRSFRLNVTAAQCVVLRA